MNTNLNSITKPSLIPDVMVDLETTGTTPSAAILSIGAVAFDVRTGTLGPRFYTTVDLQSAVDQGGTIEVNTFKWWLAQSSAAQQAVSGGQQQHISSALLDFRDWLAAECAPLEDIRIWGNGATFDPVLLAESYRRAGIELPWKFWNARCFRTVKARHPHVPMARSGTQHNALDDAITQAEHMLRMQEAPAAPNFIQFLIEDDALAMSCQSIAQYRHQLLRQLREQFAGSPPAVGNGAHTPGRLTAPITPNGRAFGLIPEGGSWADDLINWSTREFRNPADATHLVDAWNALASRTSALL